MESAYQRTYLKKCGSKRYNLYVDMIGLCYSKFNKRTIIIKERIIKGFI